MLTLKTEQFLSDARLVMWKSHGTPMTEKCRQLWDQLGALWVCIVLNPRATADERSQWKTLLDKWPKNEVCPQEDPDFRPPGRNEHETHTFRIRYPLPQFLTVAMETVEKWSNGYVIGLKTFATRPTISLKLWTESYNWARSNIHTKVLSNNKDTLVVEIEAQIVRSNKTSKHGVVAPTVNSDLQQFFLTEKAEVSVTSKVSTKKTGKRRRRAVPNTPSVKNPAKRPCVATNDLESQPSSSQDQMQLSNVQIPPAKKVRRQKPKAQPSSQNQIQPPKEHLPPLNRTRKRRCVVSKSQSEAQTSTAERPSIEEEIQILSQTVQAKLPNEVSSNVEDFETYKRSFYKWTTTIVKENVLSGSTCNCPAFGTEYICKHIVGVAIRLKLMTPPAEAKTIPIGQKRKRGRPSKTKPALMLQ